MRGNGVINGMVYVTNDLSASVGTQTVNGLVISQNSTNASGIDTTTSGNMSINFSCQHASGNFQIPKMFFPQPGTWSEPSG
jgi:hypothetical protein